MSIKKLDPKVENDLFSPKTETVLMAIQRIKEIGNRFYLPVLFDLLLTKPETEIEKEIKNLLGNVKNIDTVPVFVEALENTKYLPIQKIILTACWQNGLDFSPFLAVFAHKVIKEDWETAFEAFTVIDNLEFLPENGIVEEVRKNITEALDSASEKNKYLLKEILVKIG